MTSTGEDSEARLSARARTSMISIAAIIVFLLPYGYLIDLGPGPNGFWAILWERPEFVSGTQLFWFEAFEYFIYYIYRLVVLNALWKYSLGKMTPRRLLRHGIISELIPILISIPGVLILDESGHNYIPIMIPIPFLLLYCVLVVLYIHKIGRNATYSS